MLPMKAIRCLVRAIAVNPSTAMKTNYQYYQISKFNSINPISSRYFSTAKVDKTGAKKDQHEEYALI